MVQGGEKKRQSDRLQTFSSPLPPIPTTAQNEEACQPTNTRTLDNERVDETDNEIREVPVADS